MSEDDLLQVLQGLTGRSYAREIKRWVHSTVELPLKELLEQHGVAIQEEPAQLAQQLGLRVAEGSALQIKTVLRGGAAERAGLAAGDEWLGVEIGSGKTRSGWRLTKLDDLPLYAGAHPKVQALVARDKRLLKLTLNLPRAVTTWRLAVRDQQLIERWLAT